MQNHMRNLLILALFIINCSVSINARPIAELAQAWQGATDWANQSTPNVTAQQQEQRKMMATAVPDITQLFSSKTPAEAIKTVINDWLYQNVPERRAALIDLMRAALKYISGASMPYNRAIVPVTKDMQDKLEKTFAVTKPTDLKNINDPKVRNAWAEVGAWLMGTLQPNWPERRWVIIDTFCNALKSAFGANVKNAQRYYFFSNKTPYRAIISPSFCGIPLADNKADIIEKGLIIEPNTINGFDAPCPLDGFYVHFTTADGQAVGQKLENFLPHITDGFWKITEANGQFKVELLGQ